MKILFLPGWSYLDEFFKPLMELQTEQFQIKVIDHFRLAGKKLNASRPSRRFPYSNNLKQIIQQFSPDRVVGWSMGGIILLEYLCQVSDVSFQPVIFGATPRFVGRKNSRIPGVSAKYLRAMRQKLKNSPAEILREFYRLASDPSPVIPPARLIDQLLKKNSGDLILGLNYLNQIDLINQLQQIEQKILIVAAADDQIVPAAAGEFLATQLVNSEFQLIQGGHALAHTDPARFLKIITAKS